MGLYGANEKIPPHAEFSACGGFYFKQERCAVFCDARLVMLFG